MSTRPDLADAPDLIPDADGLDLPVAEHVPMDLDDLCAPDEDALSGLLEDDGDAVTDLSFLDAPEPGSLQLDDPEALDDDPSVQGFLPPPEHPRGEQGFLLLTTDEKDIRGRMLTSEEHDRDGVTRGEAALRDWRIKAGLRDKETSEREFERRSRRNARLGATVGAAALTGLLVWAGSVVLSPNTDQPKPPPVTPEVLAAVATPLEVPVDAAEAVAQVVTVPTQLWAPPVHAETLKSWVVDDYRYWQFDFSSAGPMSLRWVDAAGATQLDDTQCNNRVDAEVGRCYVGRNLERFRALVQNGAAAGTWTLVGCVDGRCGPVTDFEVPAG